MPISTLLGELDGQRFRVETSGPTARALFSGPAVIVDGHPFFSTGAPNWSTQPHCKVFGINTPFSFARARFGWSASQENDCQSNDTAIGFGVFYTPAAMHGAAYVCQASSCSAGQVNTGGNGFLWGR